MSLFWIPVLAGCSNWSTPPQDVYFNGTRDSSFDNGWETLSVHADGKYEQKITSKSHHTIVNHGYWVPGNPVPGSHEPGPWMVLSGEINPSDWCAHPTKVTKSTVLISAAGFVTPETAESPSTTTVAPASPAPNPVPTTLTPLQAFEHSPIVVCIAALLFAVWLYALIDAGRKGKWGWLAAIVLCTGCGALLYFVFGISGGPAFRGDPGVPETGGRDPLADYTQPGD